MQVIAASQLTPGTVVSIPYGAVRHYGIISDATDAYGVPHVISLSRYAGQTTEETFTQFAHGKDVRVEHGIQGRLCQHQVLANARAEIGNGVGWHPLWNCEHAVRRWHGLVPESPQAQIAFGVVAVVVAACVVAVAAKAA